MKPDYEQKYYASLKRSAAYRKRILELLIQVRVLTDAVTDLASINASR